MAKKIKGQRLQNGELELFHDVDAYHKGTDTFGLAVDETDGLLYLQINGRNVGEGVEVGGGSSVVRYNVSYTIPHVTSSNASTKIVEGRTFTTQLTADQDFEIKSVTVTMGSVEVPNSYNSETGILTVSNVTGDLAIVVVSKALIIFNEVQWVDTIYGIGDNKNAYNAWCPGCAKYDETLNKVIFLQCHATAHNGTYSASELWAIDPYNVMDNSVLLHEFPVVNNVVPLCFDIYNNVYYVVSKNRVYTSSDHGQTWTENSVVTAPARAYALKIIDDVMYVGDDAMNDANIGLYYTSTDGGLNWQTNKFDFAESYGSVLNCSEAEFIKFNGKLYASIRRTDLTGLLAVLDNGVWKVISEELPNVNSDCFLFATDSDVIAFAAIDRPNTTLKLGTVTIDENDVATVSVAKSVNVNGGSKTGAFHTPTYVIGPDFHMVTFMTSANTYEYQTANNACLVGYTDLSLNQNPSYSITSFTATSADVTDTPYAGTVSREDGKFVVSANQGVINLTKHYASIYPPDEDGNVYTYLTNPGEAYSLGSSVGFIVYDVVQRDGSIYACRNTGQFVKQMYPAKKSVRANINTLGITPPDGVFDYAFLVPVNWTTATDYLKNWALNRSNWNAVLIEPQNVGTL